MTAEDQQPPEGEKPRSISQSGLFNLVLTVGLLVFGAVTIANNLSEYVNPGTLINQVLSQLHASTPGFPELTYDSTPTTAAIGAILLTLQGANFGLITWWAFTRLRAGKSSFWVPLVGAAISSTMTFIFMSGLLLSDSAVMNAILEFGKSQG